jgi:hypothetical protein
MDRDRFDALTRLVATSASRRAALTALLGAGLSGIVPGAETQGKGKGKRRRGRDRRRERDKKGSRNRNRDRAGRAGAAAEAACCSTGNCAPGPGKNLFKCCYRGQNLAGGNFRGANLGQASFAGATLTKANFSGANLDRVCFVDADLTGATLAAAASAIFCRTTMPNGSVNDAGCGRGTNCCPTCDDDGDCGNGQICCDGRCRTGDCCTNADCPADQPICTRNTCGSCTGDAQCGTGRVCCDQQCRNGDCCDDISCGARGNICRDFTCGCGAGAACAGATRSCCGQGDSAVCRDCCDSDDCSGNTPFCDANGVCAQCLQNGDCTTSDPCQDAVCDNGACQTTAKDDGESCVVGQDGGVCCGGACDLGAQCCGNAQCTNPDRPFCAANGQCVACRNADDCDALPCQTATCTANGLCEYDDQGNGSACDDGGAGVCCGGVCNIGAQCCTNAQCTTPAAPVCDANGRCVCPAGRVTCDNRCCDQGQICNTAATPNVCCTPTKTTCEAGVDCGNVSDGCGGTIDCQTCPQRTCRTVACTNNACAYTDAPNGAACQIGQETGVCCAGQCRSGNCCANADCPDPAAPVCRNNVCAACTADEQCGPNRTCCNGRCGTGGCCTANDQCGDGRVCCDGRCREGTCCTNAECRVPGSGGGTLVCRDNVCTPCTANAECGQDHLCDLREDISNRFGTCHVCDVLPDPDGLQQTLGEAVAEARSGDIIYICPGEHLVGKFDAKPHIAVNNLTLYGAGSGDNPAINTVLNVAFNFHGGLRGIINAASGTNVMHLSVEDGDVDLGGAFFNDGDLTLQDVAISRCHANSGGGIFNVGALVLDDVTISDCTAKADGSGIAQGNGSGAVTLRRVAISRCAATGAGVGRPAHGGGIAGTGAGGATLVETTIVGCTSTVSGGGISWEDSGTLTLSVSTISGCTAIDSGGGIFNAHTLGDDPGSPDEPPAELAVILDGSLVSGCSAGGPGGGIFNQGELILRNDTVIRNNRSDTEPNGQGLFNRGTITCETRPVPNPNPNPGINPRVCGNPGNASATLATNCRNTGSSCNNASRPVCLGSDAPGSGACSAACTSNGDCRSGPCCDGFCVEFGDCCGDADCTDPDVPNCISNVCAACTVDGQCGPDRVCCDGVCQECCNRGDCDVATRRQCCNGTCQECCDSAQCPVIPRTKPICNPEGICVPCENDGECLAGGKGDRCCLGECRTGQC